MNVFTALALFFAAGQVNPGALSAQPPFGGADARPSLPSTLSTSQSALPENPIRGTFPVENNGPAASTGTYPQPPSSLSGGTGSGGGINQGDLSRSTYPGSTDLTLASLDPEHTYGWDYDESGELCYIVQLSPDHAQQMLKERQLTGEVIYANSTMPKELVGRIRKVSVQIGTERLPRNPPLERIDSVARLDRLDVEAELDRIGAGAMARVEPDNQAMPVQLPGSAQGYGQPNTGGRIGDTSSALSSQFLNDTRDNTALPDYDAFGNNRAPTSSGQPDYNRDSMSALPTSTPGRNDYQRTPIAGGQGNYDSSATTYADPPALGGPRLGQLGFGQTPSAPSFSQQPSLVGAGERVSDQRNRRSDPIAGYNDQEYPFRGSTPPPNNQGGFTNNMRDIQQPGAYPDGGSQQLPDYRLADARNTLTQLPSTSGAADSRNLSQPLSSSDIENRNRELAEARAEAKAEALAEAEELKKAESAALRNQNNLIGLFCVLSLVVNCYLFTLIRKLLTRYRTLLTNVRSQAA